MRALGLSFIGPRSVEWSELQLPSVARGELLVRTLYSGVSAGTELLAYKGEIDPDLPLDETIGALGGTFRYPFRYGYSCVGTVEVATERVPQGTVVFALHPHQTAFVVPDADALRIDVVDPRLATMFPLVETALQVCLDAGAVAHEVVALTGLGAVGLLTGALLTRAGARVIGSDPVDDRRRVADSLGFEAVLPEGLPERVREATARAGVPLVVEASGRPEVLAGALGLLAHEGTALVASWYGNKVAPLPLGADFHRRRLSIRSTQVGSIPRALSARWTIARRRAAAASLLQELPLKLLGTHEFPHLSAASAYEALDRGDAGLIHVALRYD